MSKAKIFTREVTFQPAAVGTAETTALLTLLKGQRILSVQIIPLIAAAASTNTTISLGPTGTVAGLSPAYDTETAVVGTPIDGGSASLLTNSGGYLALADVLIKADYINGGTPGAVNPKCKFRITIQDERY